MVGRGKRRSLFMFAGSCDPPEPCTICRRVTKNHLTYESTGWRIEVFWPFIWGENVGVCKDHRDVLPLRSCWRNQRIFNTQNNSGYSYGVPRSERSRLMSTPSCDPQEPRSEACHVWVQEVSVSSQVALTVIICSPMNRPCTKEVTPEDTTRSGNYS